MRVIRKAYSLRVLLIEIVGGEPFLEGLKSPDLVVLPHVISRLTLQFRNQSMTIGKAGSGIFSDRSARNFRMEESSCSMEGESDD